MKSLNTAYLPFQLIFLIPGAALTLCGVLFDFQIGRASCRERVLPRV